MKQLASIAAISLIILFTVVIYTSCQNADVPKTSDPLEGVWKFESRDLTAGTNIPNLDERYTQSYKFISKTRFALITQDTSQNLFWAKTGTYSISGNNYIENIEVSSSKKQIDTSSTLNFELKGDEWIVSNKLGREVWKRVE
ncbi:MAG: DUF4488 domain-containing protein [bacterium]|jgi:hypothetical protein|nr:DUF4488 domain-containing protein [bacterium]